jgi:hypothetical protein
MAGLAGATEVLGVQLRYLEGFSPGYGFAGIAVAMMASANPLGVVLAALVLGAIRTGALTMDRTTSIPADFVMVIQGLILIFLVRPSFYVWSSRDAGQHRRETRTKALLCRSHLSRSTADRRRLDGLPRCVAAIITLVKLLGVIHLSAGHHAHRRLPRHRSTIPAHRGSACSPLSWQVCSPVR